MLVCKFQTVSGWILIKFVALLLFSFALHHFALDKINSVCGAATENQIVRLCYKNKCLIF